MILFIAGAHVDVTAKLLQHPVMGASNPVSLVATPGGSSLNTARNTAKLGGASHLLSAIGDDDYAHIVEEATRRDGITAHLVRVDGAATGSFTAVIKPDGEQLIGLADLAIYDLMNTHWIRQHAGETLTNADAIVVNANLATGVLMELCLSKPTDQRLYGATISPAKAERLKPVLQSLDCLFTNVAEAAALLDTQKKDPRELVNRFAALARVGNGPRTGVISHQGNPAWWWDGGKTGAYSFEAPWLIADVTGGGDALAGTMVAALEKGMTVKEALPLALAASRMTIETKGAVCEELSWQALEETMQAMAIREV